MELASFFDFRNSFPFYYQFWKNQDLNSKHLSANIMEIVGQ
jgi:hypothetical protein